MTDQERFQRLLALYGGKPSYAEATWDTYEHDSDNDNAVKRLLEVNFSGRGLFLFGPPGTGKSFMLKILFNHVIQWKVDLQNQNASSESYPYWVKLSNFLEIARKDSANVMQKIYDADWLFLDDLGTSTSTDWAVDQVFQLLDYRIETKKQTFITSNLSLPELGDKYHARVASRVAELCFPVPVLGKDRRVLKLVKERKNK